MTTKQQYPVLSLQTRIPIIEWSAFYGISGILFRETIFI